MSSSPLLRRLVVVDAQVGRRHRTVMAVCLPAAVEQIWPTARVRYEADTTMMVGSREILRVTMELEVELIGVEGGMEDGRRRMERAGRVKIPLGRIWTGGGDN